MIAPQQRLEALVEFFFDSILWRLLRTVATEVEASSKLGKIKKIVKIKLSKLRVYITDFLGF